MLEFYLMLKIAARLLVVLVVVIYAIIYWIRR